jgi:hypothetical protein
MPQRPRWLDIMPAFSLKNNRKNEHAAKRITGFGLLSKAVWRFSA